MATAALQKKTKEELTRARKEVAGRRKDNLKQLELEKKDVVVLKGKLKRQAERIEELTAKINATKKPLREKAFLIAEGMIGVMEEGGNNTGPEVDKIIRANGGVIGEPWCGDFVAYCYRKAGSTKVDRAWASVNAIETGNQGDFTRITNPGRGDIVTFSFSHTGHFSHWINRKQGLFATIEGNTGSVGATSDSLTGGDGVYAKNRSTSLGVMFWRVNG